MAAQKCKHNACHCSGEEIRNDGYCSDACKQSRMQGGKCACGHPQCR